MAAPTRFVVVDVLRGIAILGMIWAHTQRLSPDLLPERVDKLVSMASGAATPLFMLVAGVTIAILTARDGDAFKPRHFRLEYALRGVFLILAGVLIEQWSLGINIVLPYIGVTFIAAVPLLIMRSRWLLVWASVVFFAAPFVAAFVRRMLEARPELLYPTIEDHPVAYLADWLFTGRAYHMMWLLPFLLLGIVVGRNLLSPKWSLHWLTGLGFVILAGYWLTTRGIDEADRVRGDHAELFFDLARALIVFGIVASIIGMRAAAPRRLAFALASPVALVGRMPITIYVLHVVVVTLLYGSSLYLEPTGFSSSLLSLAWVYGVCIVFSIVWGLTLGTGPVERIMGVFSLRHPPRWALAVQPVRARDLGLGAQPAHGPTSASPTPASPASPDSSTDASPTEPNSASDASPSP